MSPAYIYVMANPLRHLQGQISSKAHIGSSAPDELLRAGAPEEEKYSDYDENLVNYDVSMVWLWCSLHYSML